MTNPADVSAETLVKTVNLLERFANFQKSRDWVESEKIAVELNQLAIEQPWVLAAVVASKATDLEIRVLAAVRLRACATEDAGELFIPFLAHDSPRDIRYEALLAARKLRVNGATSAIIRMLRSERDDGKLFSAAIAASGAIGGKENQEILCEFLADPSLGYLEDDVAAALAEGGDAEAAKFVLQRWLSVGLSSNGGADWTHKGLLLALSQFRNDVQASAVAELYPTVSGESIETASRRNRILATLMENRSEGATQFLKGVALSDAPYQTKLSAVFALRNVERDGGASALLEITATEGNPVVAREAAFALVNTPTKDFEAIKLKYQEALRSGRSDVAILLAASLSSDGQKLTDDPSLVASLRDMMAACGGAQPDFKQLIQINLAAQEPDPHATLERLFEQRLAPAAKLAVLRNEVMRDTNNAAVQNVLARAVGDADVPWDSRFRAARDLEKSGQFGKAAASLLRSVAEDAIPHVATTSVQIIRNFGDVATKQQLEKMLASMSPARRAELSMPLPQPVIDRIREGK